MEANELMIGDWVKLDFYDNAYVDKEDAVWKNGKITAIHHGNWVDINFGGHLDECDIEVEDIQPIPITPELLEKNGFTNGEFYAESHIEDWQIMSDGSHLVARSERGWCIDIPCRYVHQLQHALRLCGIDKEITI